MIKFSQKKLMAFIRKVFSGLRSTLAAILCILVALYAIMNIFPKSIGDSIDQSTFLHLGFWGLAFLFFIPSALLVNLIVTIFYSFKPVRRLRDLLLPILISAFVVALAGSVYFYVTEGQQLPVLSDVYIMAWTAYFTFVPQAFVHSILPGTKVRQTIWIKFLYFVARLVISVVFLFLLLTMHAHLGSVFGITPD